MYIFYFNTLSVVHIWMMMKKHFQNMFQYITKWDSDSSSHSNISIYAIFRLFEAYNLYIHCDLFRPFWYCWTVEWYFIHPMTILNKLDLIFPSLHKRRETFLRALLPERIPLERPLSTRWMWVGDVHGGETGEAHCREVWKGQKCVRLWRHFESSLRN